MIVGQTLIDTASKIHGSRYRVAQLLGESEANLGSMARGTRHVPPRIAAKLASLIGIDSREAACAALIESTEDPTEREHLRAMFRIPPESMLWLHLRGIKSSSKV